LTTLSQLMDLRGTRTMITGGLGHLGKVIAETLAELGSDLVIVDMPGSHSEDFCSRLTSTWDVSAIYFACDLENESDHNSLISLLKSDGMGLTCLVNNAAFVGNSDLQGWVVPFEEQTIQTWRRALEVNLTAASIFPGHSPLNYVHLAKVALSISLRFMESMDQTGVFTKVPLWATPLPMQHRKEVCCNLHGGCPRH